MYHNPQSTRIQGHPVPPQATQPTGPTDLLPDGEETFQDFILPQFAVPSNSIGEEQLRRPVWTLSSYSRPRMQPQPCAQTPTHPSMPT